MTEITSKLVHQIVMDMTSSRCKLEAVKILSKYIVDPDGKDVISTELPPIPNLKKQVEKVLQSTFSASQLFGHIGSKRVVFLVDTSTSMSQEFQVDHHRANPKASVPKDPLRRNELFFQASRLALSTHEIRRFLTSRLPKDFRFNIITFGEQVNRWKPHLQLANKDTVESACEFLSNATENGGTNTFQALQYALENLEDDLDAIYMMSDGDPTRGVEDVNVILSYVKDNIAKRQRKVIIHTTAVLMGQNHDSEEPKARKFMADLAAVSGGVFRCIEEANFAPAETTFTNETASELPEAFESFYTNKIIHVPEEILLFAKLHENSTDPIDYQTFWKLMKSRLRDGQSDLDIQEYFVEGKEIFYRINVNLEWKETVQPSVSGVSSLNLCWSADKSFKDFHDLHAKIHGEMKKRDLHIHLPPDPFFTDKKSKEFLHERMNLLREYVRQIYDEFNPVEYPYFNDFLQFEQNLGKAS
eukprot:Phypoly_transcript_01969.p1 GENE.Phypoly_transcript_01969~~Phypoly_transcript_01969.p1  ORF type:complete len:507 (+),score=54.36 Phypoly_transcript_01969:107-1522(+)